MGHDPSYVSTMMILKGDRLPMIGKGLHSFHHIYPSNLWSVKSLFLLSEPALYSSLYGGLLFLYALLRRTGPQNGRAVEEPERPRRTSMLLSLQPKL